MGQTPQKGLHREERDNDETRSSRIVFPMSEDNSADDREWAIAEHSRIAAERYLAAAPGLFKELAEAGQVIGDYGVYDLWYDGDSRAAPILLKWLPRVEYIHLAADIIRTLGSPWARPDGPRALVKLLPHLDDTNDVEVDGTTIRDSIGGTVLMVNTDYRMYDQILAFVSDESQGITRFLFILALGKYSKKREESIPVLRQLLSGEDDSLAFAAAKAAVKLKYGLDAIPRLLHLQQSGAYKGEIQPLLRKIKVDQAG